MWQHNNNTTNESNSSKLSKYVYNQFWTKRGQERVGITEPQTNTQLVVFSGGGDLKAYHIIPTLFLQRSCEQRRASLFRKHCCTQALLFSFMSVLITEDWWLSSAPLWLVSCHGPDITASATAALLLHNIQHRLWKHPASPPFITGFYFPELYIHFIQEIHLDSTFNNVFSGESSLRLGSVKVMKQTVCYLPS